MSLLAVVSYDADAIRIVTAQKTRDSLICKQALTLTVDELEGFLSQDQSKAYLITVNPPDALYETIAIPPVDDKLIAHIVDAELKRMHPELPAFSIGFQVIGDSVQDGRTIRRVACCLMPDELLNMLLEPFIRHNKSVRMIAATPHALAGLVINTPSDLPDTLICAYDEGERKTLLVMENGAVLFTRQVPSECRGWNSLDRQNVTMTIDYCFQTLRVRPGGAIAVNSEDPPPPFVAFEPLIPSGFPATIINEYPAQLALLMYPPPASQDLRPAAYCSALREQDLIKNISLGFAVATTLVILLLIVHGFLITAMQTDLDSLRQPPDLLHSVITTHQKAMEKRTAVEPLISILNSQHAEPSIPGLLATLALTPLTDVTISSMTAKRDKDAIGLSLTGVISKPSLADAQSQLEALGTQLSATKGITLGNRTLDPKSNKFSVEVTYKP
jgi:hypothetical protein